ncbi:uncharacterized protein MELLADRAFT_69490 [Melampsora larici-populina 98AG31]|uniref:Uncharacterized protein n=1 Tax=Melampsora larici-populina (strain 98AG31 / pathotype 3-4-7) TaxID=747676 RepID=F4SAX7_MELLP|nr:uncharacterized protein MELLADRAFT_69490 [Melampsora larici-populina 98AG31]EGF98184.1 hypothetical protein MELLADRAFT_69490 [Melampsora larici-populina 98AG31]
MSDLLTLESHPAWHQFQTVSKDLKFFFDPNLDYENCHTSRDRLRAIMAHFGVDPKHRRSSYPKSMLVESFKTHLLPIIKPFIHEPKASEAVAISEDIPKLDLAAKSTTKVKLRTELRKHVPSLKTTTAMDKTELTKLYRWYILNESDNATASGSTQSQPIRFVDQPAKWTLKELCQARLDNIRFALQFYRPDVFIPHKCSTVAILNRVYEKFILNMPVQADVITEGVHYYVRKLVK